MLISLIAALSVEKKLDFRYLENIPYDYDIAYTTVISGNRTCLLNSYSDGLLYCWNTYDLSAKPHLVKSDYKFYDISIYGNQACALSWDPGYYRLYCTKDIGAGSVDWSPTYITSDKHFLTVELDDNSLCISSLVYVKCTTFSTIFDIKPVWKEIKVVKGPITDISISGKRACVNYYFRNISHGESICTDDFSTESPDWRKVKAPVFHIRINKNKMCGKMRGLFRLTCYQDGKWHDFPQYLTTMALDSTHILIGDSSVERFFVAEFPK